MSGQVLAARELQSDYLLAIKKVSREQLLSSHVSAQQLKREIIIQASLNHPNILKLYGYFWDREHIYLLLEYAPAGEVYRLLQMQGQLAEATVSAIVRQVCQGVKYLHERNIIHRDIKP